MFCDTEVRPPHDWIADSNLEKLYELHESLCEEQYLCGSHPQLAQDIADIEAHIEQRRRWMK